MGDFFELFFDDARTAAQSARHCADQPGRAPGRADPDVRRAGPFGGRLPCAADQGRCRVAIAEQTETPEEAKKRGGSKALVARDIVRFVTAGTLTEEALLEPRRANVLAAVCEVRGSVGIAACDISTGRMELEECAPDRLGAALARLGASEIVAPEGWELAPPETIARPPRDFSSDGGEARLKAVHGVATLDGFGQFDRAMLAAAGGLIAYLDHVGRGRLPLLLPPVAAQASRASPWTRRRGPAWKSSPLAAAAGAGSLIEAVDRCVTGAGARLLAEDLSAPLTDAARDRSAARAGPVAAGRSAAARRPAHGAARAARHRAGAGPRGRGARFPRAIWGSCAMA
jgi:DNA mismatch repair protein MutS